MDAAQMRNLMENYRNLKGGVEGCKEKIQRIEEYIDYMRIFNGQSGSNVLLYRL